jgi:ATP-dependent exoDNAse (exonuclease V) beta subunit
MSQRVPQLIRELSSRFLYEDIAVLARDNEEVEEITSWMLKDGIPVESEKTLNILENEFIKEIILFLKFLSSPIDNVSFASFIMGEIFFNMSGISKQQMHDFIFLLNKEGVLKSGRSLYTFFRDKYRQVWDEYIDEFFKTVGFVSVYELCVSIYQKFRVVDRFPGQQAFLMKFLDIVKEKEDEYVDLERFLVYLDEAPPEDLYVDASGANSVRVFTIHKAKGLEFKVVIIPFLRIDINPEAGGRGTNLYLVESNDGSLRLVRIKKHYCAYSQKLSKIYTDAYKKACIDECDNIYVALTIYCQILILIW